MHLARCYRVVDLGTQKSEYLGTVKHLPKVMLQFEVHGEDEAGKPIVTAKNEPMTISKNFTLSLAEKATLRKDPRHGAVANSPRKNSVALNSKMCWARGP
jgi:hypothetical protein